MPFWLYDAVTLGSSHVVSQGGNVWLYSWFSNLGWDQWGGSLGLAWGLWCTCLYLMGCNNKASFTVCLAWSHISFYISPFSCRAVVAWNLGSKRENSKMTSAYQISPCISLLLSHLPKPSHMIKLRSSVERSKQHKGRNSQRHGSWGITNVFKQDIILANYVCNDPISIFWGAGG